MPASVLEKQETVKTSEQKSIFRAPIALYENAESYIVLVELPGADDKSVQVRLEKGILTVEAVLKLDLPPGAVPKYSEVRLGDYKRTVEIGDLIEEEKIEAEFKSGMLKLTLPKSGSTKARNIPIKTV